MHPAILSGPRPAIMWTIALAFGATNIVAALELQTPEPPPRPRVLMDYYHHAKPGLRIGKNIVTGNWADNLGRYGIDDFYHNNGFDPLVQALQREFALVVHEKPFMPETLVGADIVFIFTPDSRLVRPDAPVISDEEIDALTEFVRQGGSLLLMVNSHHKTEKFEQVQFKKLFRRFSLDWHENDTRYVDIQIGPEHPYFYDIDVFHYGAGCTLEYLPGELKPETLLHVHGDVGDEHVQGPGLALVRYGKGKVLACGDTGSWGANMSRPWAENATFLVQMFRFAKRCTGIRPPRYEAGQRHVYRMDVAQTIALPRWNSLLDLPQPESKTFVPREKSRIPYLESSAKVTLACTAVGNAGVMEFRVGVADWRRFDRPLPGPADRHVLLTTNRQGAVAGLRVSDPGLERLVPEVPHLIGFVPNDGIRIGDRWQKRLRLNVPSIRHVDPGVVRPVQTEMCYARDERIQERECRVLVTSAAAWLSQLDVSVEDLLPEEEIRRRAGHRYAFHTPRGGRLLFKRQQWVDRDTGIVVRAKVQRRIVAWIRDLDKPVGKTVADVDNDMVTNVTEVTWFELQ